jgi:hypothetical protein
MVSLPPTVVVAVVAFEVVPVVLPVPKVRSWNVHAVDPPRIFDDASVVVPPPSETSPLPEKEPAVRVILPVPDTVPVDTVISPVALRFPCTFQPPPTPVNVRLWSAILSDELETNVLPVVVAVITTVLEAGANVELAYAKNEPPILYIVVPAPVNVELASK